MWSPPGPGWLGSPLFPLMTACYYASFSNGILRSCPCEAPPLLMGVVAVLGARQPLVGERSLPLLPRPAGSRPDSFTLMIESLHCLTDYSSRFLLCHFDGVSIGPCASSERRHFHLNCSAIMFLTLSKREDTSTFARISETFREMGLTTED